MPTMREVAEMAGVSVATVSHVVNRTRFVATKTRERVFAAMESLNYQPNELARSLRRGQTRTIGLILPDSANPFFADIGRGSETASFEAGYNTIFCNTSGISEKVQLYLKVLQKKQVDGIIFVASGDQTTLLDQLLQKNFPVVIMVDRDMADVPADTVLADTLQGGYNATRHLTELGHNRIGCISGPQEITERSGRLDGYMQAISEAGLPFDPEIFRYGNFHPDSGYEAMLHLLQVPSPPTALFIYNDLMAIGALRAAAEKGVRIPEDMAIVSFDNIELAAYTTPQLTTIAQPTFEMGQTAVSLLLNRIENPDLPRQQRILPTNLVVRGSCGARLAERNSR